VVVDGKEREIVAHGNDLFVELKHGEEYSIQVESKTSEPVMMRLLVDGLNTLPERDGDEIVVAKRVNLDEARPWHLDFASQSAYTFEGFVTETGEQGRQGLFTVGDASESPAVRQNFTEQVGIITAAIYDRVADKRGLATIPGREVVAKLNEIEGFSPGAQRQIIHIRYSHYADERHASATQ
jgi:hypothetical protein